MELLSIPQSLLPQGICYRNSSIDIDIDIDHDTSAGASSMKALLEHELPHLSETSMIPTIEDSPKRKHMRRRRRKRSKVKRLSPAPTPIVNDDSDSDADADVDNDGSITINFPDVEKSVGSTRKRGVLADEVPANVVELVENITDLEKYSVIALKAFCEEYGLKKTGRRQLIVRRVFHYIKDQQSEDAQDEQSLEDNDE